VFQTLKLKLGPYGIGVFYATVLQEYHRKATADELKSALEELEREKPSGSPSWIRRERTLIWIRNGLRFDPALSMSNPNHKKGALRHALALPSKTLCAEFIAYYELEDAESLVSGRPRRKADATENKSPLNPISQRQQIRETETETERERERERETETETDATRASSPSSSSPEEERVAQRLSTEADRAALAALVHAAPAPTTWLAEMNAALDGMAGHTFLTPLQLGEALRDFVGNGDLARLSFSRFRGYLRNANKPPPGETNGRGRARAGGARNDVAIDTWLAEKQARRGERSPRS
jgi:hypothetical protein